VLRSHREQICIYLLRSTLCRSCSFVASSAINRSESTNTVYTRVLRTKNSTSKALFCTPFNKKNAPNANGGDSAGLPFESARAHLRIIPFQFLRLSCSIQTITRHWQCLCNINLSERARALYFALCFKSGAHAHAISDKQKDPHFQRSHKYLQRQQAGVKGGK
jgi:hypothetical protein